MQITHKGTVCDVSLRHYQMNKDRVAIILTDAEDGGPYDIPSVNIPDAALGEGEVCIRDDSFHAGVLDALIDGGIVAAPHRRVPMGYITAAVCRLLIAD